MSRVWKGKGTRWTRAAFRLSLVVLVAVVMAVIGYQLTLREGPERWTLDRQSFYCVWPSVLLWLALAPLLARGNYVTAVGWGVLSPFLGALLVAGPYGIFLPLVLWQAFPVGALTGALVKLAVSVGRNDGAGAASRPVSPTAGC